MPKIAVLHESPSNSSAHRALISEVQKSGFDPEPLRNALWLINAHDRLIAFPRICRNIVNIIEAANNTWGRNLTPELLEEAVPALCWIAEHGDSLAHVGQEFNRQPKNDRDHPVMSRGSSRHPLYTTLWNTCESSGLTPRYLLLQAQLLFAHAIQINRSTTRTDYEQYAGQEEWKGMPNSPYGACLTVRELSEARYSDILSNLQTEFSPADFSKSLNHLPDTVETARTQRLEKLRDFVQKVHKDRGWISRAHSGERTGKGGSARVTGYVEITPSTFKQDLGDSDPDDQDQDWGEQSLVTDLKLSMDEQREILESDLSPEEFDAEEMLLSGYASPMVGTLAANAGAQLRHVKMANQMFPWAYGQLTISDFGPHWFKTATWVKERFVDSQKPASKKEWDKLEAFILLRIMIFTGSSFERARNIQDYSKANPNVNADLAFLRLSDESYAFKIKAITPEYKTEKSIRDGSERLRTDGLLLPDISISINYIKILQKKPARKEGNEFALFRRKPEYLRANLLALLKELDPSGRFTIHKAENFLRLRILQVTKGDICAASLICGELHPLARVRLFYSVLSAEALQKIYIAATRELADQLVKAGNRNTTLVSPNIQPLSHVVGSRLCPTFDAVKTAIARLKSDLLVASPPTESPTAHNLYTFLAVWHFSFATACRAIETPYLHPSFVDPVSGIALFADKDDGTGYKARLIWVPPSVLGLMKSYETYRSALSQKSSEPVFFLEPRRGDKIRTTKVRPKTLAQFMETYLPYPANFHRRFMRTELLSRGCPIEVVDAWMGHWHTGEEPWGLFSSFSFQEYRGTLQTYLSPLLDDLGLDGKVTLQTDSLVSA